MDSTAVTDQDKSDATAGNPVRRVQQERLSWKLNRELQDAAYREFKSLSPAGSPADFLEWLENAVDWMVSRTPSDQPERLGTFSDRTAYRIFRRNRESTSQR